MRKFFKNILKVIKSRSIGDFFGFLLMIVLIVWASIGVSKIGIIAVRETVQTADYLIAEEQKRDLTRFEDKIIVVEEHIDELQDELKNIKVGQWVKLSKGQKRKLLKITWELRKDSWRIESALINHENDWSVNLYPRSDESIKNKFKKCWSTHILIDRVVSDTERIVYTPRGVDKFQLKKLQENINAVEKVFNLRN